MRTEVIQIPFPHPIVRADPNTFTYILADEVRDWLMDHGEVVGVKLTAASTINLTIEAPDDTITLFKLTWL